MLGRMSPLTVSKLAARVGTSADTLRYYERIGLLPAPERSPGGYRLYGEDDVERLRFIKRAQRFGLRLRDVAELLDIREQGLCPCGHTRRLLEERLAELEDELTALTQLRDDIRGMVHDMPTQQSGGEGWQCNTDLLRITDPPETYTGGGG